MDQPVIPSVLGVFGNGGPFQLGSAAIMLFPVLVVHNRLAFRIGNEGQRHKDMKAAIHSVQLHPQITGTIIIRGQKFPGSLGSDLPKAVDLIVRMIWARVPRNDHNLSP